MSDVLQLLAEKLMKTPKYASLPEKLIIFVKSMSFHGFSKNEQVFAKKLMKAPKHASFLEKLLVLAKSTIFYAFSRNEQLFATFGRKLDENAETC